MVKKSSKSKSKRTSIRKKHKIIAKVKAHNRKERRIQRKKIKENKAKGIKPELKDPGVPSTWPFRDDFLKEMAFEKERLLQQKKLKKEQQKKSQQVAEDAEMFIDDVEVLAEDAQKRNQAFHQTTEQITEEAQDVGGREHFKDFHKVVMLADVVLVVLDARDPKGCRSEEAESCIRQSLPPKRLVFLLNKTDLIPREAVELWLKHLRQYAPTVAFKCSTQHQAKHLGQSRQRTMESASSVCLGADNLMQLLKNYARNDDIKTAITVGLVGIPNVGKSSVINSLKRSRAVHAGNTPGITTSIQEVHLDKQIRLLDSPGVIFDKKQGALQGTVKTTSISDPIGIVERVVEKVQEETLRGVYGVEEFNTTHEFLVSVAEKMGKLKKGGIPDVDATAKIIVQDWNNGKIPFYKLPPVQPAATNIQILDNWSTGFYPNTEQEHPKKEGAAIPKSSTMETEEMNDALFSGALEAFGQLKKIQESRAEVKKASVAIADMTLIETPPSTTDEANIKPEPTVKVLYRKGQNKNKKQAFISSLFMCEDTCRKMKGPVNERIFNQIAPSSRLIKIEKRKRRPHKKMKSIGQVTSEIADKLKL